MRLHYEYKEEEPYEEGFAEYYTNEIVPLADKYEAKRKKWKVINKFSLLLFLTLSIIGTYLLYKLIAERNIN